MLAMRHGYWWWTEIRIDGTHLAGIVALTASTQYVIQDDPPTIVEIARNVLIQLFTEHLLNHLHIFSCR